MDFKKQKDTAKKIFQESSFPKKDDEAWRNLDMRGFSLDDFDLSSSVIQSQFQCDGKCVDVFDLSKSESAKNPSDSSSEYKIIQPLIEGSHSDYFDLLNHAWCQNLNLVVVHTQSDSPIHINHNIKTGNAKIPRTIIYVKPGIQAQIIEEFKSDPSDSSRLWVPKTDVIAGENASIEYTAFVDLHEQDLNFTRQHFYLQRDSNVLSFLIHSGAKKSKVISRTQVLGNGASYRGVGILAGANQEICDVDMLVDHRASHTKSSLLYKTVLKDKARSMFTGNLEISQGLKDVDSHQENHNVLLSNESRAQSMPHLVIKAEEVACEHGATVGILDEEAMFFLMARGLPRPQARILLVEAFLKSTIEELSNDGLQEKINSFLLNKLSLDSLLDLKI